MSPDLSLWALNSVGSSPAKRQRFFKMCLTDCGISGAEPMDPSLRTLRKIRSVVIFANCIHSSRVTVARPAAKTSSPCPAVVAVVRPRAIRMHGAVGGRRQSAGGLLARHWWSGSAFGLRSRCASPTGSERDQEDCSISQVNGFGGVTGGQEALKDAGSRACGSCAVALRQRLSWPAGETS